MAENKASARGDALVILASSIVGAVALTSASLWIDEANSALKAMQPSLAGWWHTLVSEKGSDLQMPFYMFYLWCWEKLAGPSELALRAANVPWFVIGQMALYHESRRNRLNPMLLLSIASVSPFLWFYLNEARPYLMQYAAACVLASVLYCVADDPPAGVKSSTLWIFVLGLLVLCGSSLLGVIWAAFAGAAFLYLVHDRLRSFLRPARLMPIAIGLICLAALGVYYLWTLRVGGRASDIGRTGPLNVAFVFYELIGLAGLGPGRLELRQNGLAAFREQGLSLLPLFAGSLLLLGLAIYAISRVWANRAQRAIIAACIYAIPPIALLFALAYLQHFRILGRHFMPLLPVIIGLFAFGIREMRDHRLATVAATGLLAIWLGSALSLRLAARHAKDDYRDAAEIAKSGIAAQEKVWWSADTSAAAYYRLPLSRVSEPGAALLVAPSPAVLAAQPMPDLVLASKPDIYDPSDALGRFLREHAFTSDELPAFKIWRRPRGVVDPR